MHTDISLAAILHHVMEQLGYIVYGPTVNKAPEGKYQAHIHFCSIINCFTIYGKALDRPYETRDSSLMYALIHVDEIFGVEIVGLNFANYLIRHAE